MTHGRNFYRPVAWPEYEDTLPQAPGPDAPHVLDAALWWTPHRQGRLNRYLAAKREVLTQVGWRHTLLAPGVQARGDVDCGGLCLPGAAGHRVVLSRRRAARLIERVQPQLIEAADPSTLSWSVLDAAERLKVPAVAFCHHDLSARMERLLQGWPEPSRQAAAWAARHLGAYLLRLYARFDLVLAPSRAIVRSLQGLGLHQAQYQPLGVDCSVFSPAACDLAWRQAWLQQLGLAPATKLLLYAGRFAADKHLGLLGEAVRQLGRGHALVVIGEGPLPPRGDHVRVLPAPTDGHRLARMMAAADAFVHAGEQDSVGLCVLEAMACGTPVVVSDAGGLAEWAADVGLAVPSQRPADWAEALRCCVQGGLGVDTDRGLQRARRHDWTVVLGQLARRYHRALGMPLQAEGVVALAPMALQPALH
ncbi:MAG: glycosyltransferase [Burkholderiales bacterium]